MLDRIFAMVIANCSHIPQGSRFLKEAFGPYRPGPVTTG